MNQFSFSSEDDPNESHCLQQEIGFEQIGDWRGNSQEKVVLDEEGADTMLTQFDMDLEDASSEIIHDFSKHGEYSDLIESFAPEDAFKKSYCDHAPPLIEQFPQTLTQESSPQQQKFSPKQEQQTLPQEAQQNPSVEPSASENTQAEDGEQAITFYEATENTTVVRSTILEEKWQQGGRTVLSEFISVCETTYKPLLQAYKATAERIKAYSERSIGSLDMYCLFFRIKHEQELKRLKLLKIQDLNGTQLMNNPLLENVYLDQRTVVAEIAQKSQQSREQSETFCEQMDELINKLKLLLGKASQSRVKKMENLQSQLDRISRIQQQLIELLNHSPTVINDGWLGKADIKCDRYLQRKYLHERESLFLSLITDLREKVINLMNSIFVKEDPVMFAVLNRELIRYRNISEKLYGLGKNPPSLNKISTNQIDSSLREVLQGIIPTEWMQNVSNPTNCEELIQTANNFLQNQIFLPVVQLQQEHIRIMSQALWIPRMLNDIAKQSNNQNAKDWQATYQNLMSERNGSNPSSMKVNVVLTIDKYLHLECGQQIASLKLRKLKLSRKGKSIVISERSRSIVALFASSLVLGELEFDKEQDSSRFIDAVQNIKID